AVSSFRLSSRARDTRCDRDWSSGVCSCDLNCRGDYYSREPGEANALAPGKRPRSTLQGTLVLKDGRPHMVLGTPGADQQVLLTKIGRASCRETGCGEDRDERGYEKRAAVEV